MPLVRLLLAVIATLCLLSGASAADPRPVKVLSWNLEHFVDPYDDPYVQSTIESLPDVKPDEILLKMAQAIRKIDADVMAFQEAENDRAVKLWLDTYFPDHDYKYWACVPAMTWYQNVVVASRFPIGRIISLREIQMTNEVTGETTNLVNDRLLAVDIHPNEHYSFMLMNVHLRAGGRSEEAIAWRMEQLKLIHELLESELRRDPDLNFLAVGDFNFTPFHPEYEFFMNEGPQILWDPAEKWEFLPSHPSTGPVRRIDMMIFNENMKPEYVPGTIAIAAPKSYDALSRMSDHLPITLKFVPVNRGQGSADTDQDR